MQTKPTWKELLARGEPLLLPCAYDALSARLIERAGFAAYSVGGCALVGARHALPDIGLVGFGEMSAGIRDIMAATSLPVLVDCDDGYGDVKNVARTIAGYEAMGVSAIFMEDQRAPKRCGHMAGKDVIEADAMAAKLRAAAQARRSPDFFIIARTDARAVHGLDDALRRAELYLKAGADGLFIEAPQSLEELAQIGRAFQGVPQLANMVEGGGRTPILPPAELYRLGFAMVAYPTTLIFRVARTLEAALADLKTGRPARAPGLDRRQRRRGDRRIRSHDPDAGEGPAHRRRGAARPIPGLRARRADGESAELPLAGRPQGHEDRRHRARLEHALHGAASLGQARPQARRRVVRRHRRERERRRGGPARRDRRHRQRCSRDQPLGEARPHQGGGA